MTERPAGRDLHNDDAQLANPRAERVKKVAALAGRSARSRAGLFLVEGPQGAREAVRFAAPRVRDLYLTPDAAARFPEILAEAQEAGIYTHLGTDAVLHAMSPDCQGVVAVVETAGQSLEDALSSTPRLVAVLADVRDPGNAGTVIRAADAAGADAVVLVGESVDLTNPKVVRSTAGSLFHLPVVRGGSLEDAALALSEAGLRIVAADGAGTEAKPAREFTPADPVLAEPTAWVFGNEAHGLASEELALADDILRIPIHGHAESLNLATAAAICLYASAWAQS
jgi:TrmH family RNA methyltransferase